MEEMKLHTFHQIGHPFIKQITVAGHRKRKKSQFYFFHIETRYNNNLLYCKCWVNSTFDDDEGSEINIKCISNDTLIRMYRSENSAKLLKATIGNLSNEEFFDHLSLDRIRFIHLIVYLCHSCSFFTLSINYYSLLLLTIVIWHLSQFGLQCPLSTAF